MASADEHLGLIPGYSSSETAKPGYRFDIAAAEQAVAFFPDLLRHVKGPLGGQPVVLEPWQQAIIANLWGWKRADGTRRYRECFIFVPRKNGKTTMCAGIALLGLIGDNELGAEIYSSAADREQAALLYSQAKGMVLQEPELEKRLRIHETYKSISYDATNSSYKAISADANTKHGFNSHIVINDEIHAQKNRELIDVLSTSTGSRSQPLEIHITTSDFHRESICNEKHDYASKVRDGVIDDPSFLPVIYEATLEDDWTDPKVWAKANPNLGVSVSLDYLERECKRAQDQPTYENTFKRLHLNIRTEQDVRWIQMADWDACSGLARADYHETAGTPCYGGLDLASTRDVSALVLAFPERDGDATIGYELLCWFWIPSASSHERERRDRVPYATWVRQGHMRATEGEVTDFQHIRRDILAIRDQYNIVDIGIDPWAANDLMNQLSNDGLDVVEFRQGFASMSAPCKEFEKRVVSRSLRHGGHPVLRWMASNVTVEHDSQENYKCSKKKSTEKIDGIVAAVMAIGRAMAHEDSGPSIYESRGLTVL